MFKVMPKQLNTQYPNVPLKYNVVYKCKVNSMDVETTILFESGMVNWWAENVVYWYEPDTQIKHINTNLIKMKNSTNESITKNSANLDEIMNNVDQMDTLLNSRDFQTALVNDLINGKRNVTEWKIVDGNGSLESIEPHTIKDTFGIDYSFDFKYKYGDQLIPLTIFISGDVPFSVSPRVAGDYFNQAEGGAATVDYKNLGSGLDLGLFDKDGSEVDISWLTPELEKKLTKSIIADYV